MLPYPSGFVHALLILLYLVGTPPSVQDLAQLDPRYVELYDALTTHEKCAKMVHFFTSIVSNMRQQFHFDDPHNLPNVIGEPQHWSLGDGVAGNELFEIFPRRASLALNIALLSFAEGALKSGDDDCFNEAFLGNGDINNSGSMFGVTMAEMVTEMLPLRDRDLVSAL
jgi:hypothetical protein